MFVDDGRVAVASCSQTDSLHERRRESAAQVQQQQHHQPSESGQQQKRIRHLRPQIVPKMNCNEMTTQLTKSLKAPNLANSQAKANCCVSASSSSPAVYCLKHGQAMLYARMRAGRKQPTGISQQQWSAGRVLTFPFASLSSTPIEPAAAAAATCS